MRSPTTVWNSATEPGVAEPPLPSSTGVFFFEQPAMARNATHSTASLNPETNLSIVPTPCTRGTVGRPEWKAPNGLCAGCYSHKTGQLDGDSQAFPPNPPPGPTIPAYFSRGDHAGSEANPGVFTTLSFRPVMSTL